MNDYQAPLADMRFVLRELLDLEQLGQLPGFGEITVDVADAVLDEAAKFAGSVLSPLNRSGDLEGVRWQEGEVLTAAGWKQAYDRFAPTAGMRCPARRNSAARIFPGFSRR
jgi:acyl-CoA dehydrogenase